MTTTDLGQRVRLRQWDVITQGALLQIGGIYVVQENIAVAVFLFELLPVSFLSRRYEM